MNADEALMHDSVHNAAKHGTKQSPDEDGYFRV